MTKKIKIILGIVIVVIIIAGIWYGVSREPAGEGIVTPGKPIKIGVLGDLSGDYATYFRGIPRGVELAVEDLKKETNRKIEVILEDQKSCVSQETVTIMNKFVGIDKVDVIIGGSCSNSTLAATPIAGKTRTVMVSPASSAPSISQAGEYIFRTYVSDVLRAKEITELVYSLGKRKMAIIVDIGNDAAIQLGEGSKEVFETLGGSIVAEEEITRADTGFRTQLAKIREAKPDVLQIIFMGANQIALVAKQAKEIGLNVLLVMPNETIEDPVVLEEWSSVIEGIIYVVPGNPPETSAYQKLKSKHAERYNEKDMPPYTVEAYDAVMLGVKAVLASDGTKEDVKDKLYEVSKTYQGVSGNVTFDENGDVTKPVIFKTIKNGEFVLYED